jgi:hypothetical protein
MQVSNDTTSVIDTDTAVCGIAGIEYWVLGIAHHYTLDKKNCQYFLVFTSKQKY